jgi:predicted acylesterase/phospholipase RssA
MVSEIAVALISGGSALGGAIVGSSGAIVGSLVAQRAEKRRRRQESRAALIAQWRNDIRQLRNAEINHLARNEENKKQAKPRSPIRPKLIRGSTTSRCGG